jgi:hypothetical protein
VFLSQPSVMTPTFTLRVAEKLREKRSRYR